MLERIAFALFCLILFFTLASSVSFLIPIDGFWGLSSEMSQFIGGIAFVAPFLFMASRWAR
ncbi:MAG: hypothetical protein COU90_00805 [Candidatus Ryanbacteria bacterium CG10_big_fil_rev_8_21_14_0_10_43_42]|uniref:Uncharacterized protein n=1 Tax=Candidatus Ryanbacteria bacterium CG10_big_fil_rev_8_21_14_0_10_43_42 TaxID=1974864 RepID=A0A2M8KY18_9BACT|nr:MAG: hypothetical protein COU90_00805 [Candidatus Ryanbacteria bacterium CG10_big_fil_rev_8_21_14_0_10_43_42]